MIKKNIFSILVAMIIMYLSLANAKTFESVSVFDSIPNFDKFVHVAMYFGLMSAILIEHRNSLQSRRQSLIVGLIPFSYGVLMEILQSTLTQTRTGSVFDAMADAIGILISILIWFWFYPAEKSDKKSDS